jgi:hypothetical protein
MTPQRSSLYQKVRFSDRALLLLSVVMVALAIALPFAVVYRVRMLPPLAGIVSVLGSPVCLILSIIELVRYERRWRTIVAVVASVIATAVCWVTMLRLAYGHFH